MNGHRGAKIHSCKWDVSSSSYMFQSLSRIVFSKTKQKKVQKWFSNLNKKDLTPGRFKFCHIGDMCSIGGFWKLQSCSHCFHFSLHTWLLRWGIHLESCMQWIGWLFVADARVVALCVCGINTQAPSICPQMTIDPRRGWAVLLISQSEPSALQIPLDGQLLLPRDEYKGVKERRNSKTSSFTLPTSKRRADRAASKSFWVAHCSRQCWGW